MKYISIIDSKKKKHKIEQRDMINSFFFNYNSRMIQEYFQAKIGQKNKNIQPGPKTQHSSIKQECM